MQRSGFRVDILSESWFHNLSLKMDPLHGVKLETIVRELEAEFGFERLGQLIPINCFISDPSVKSSLTFLRKTPWARTKVEELYINRIYNIRNSQ